jgi:hypothetical protein
MTPNSNPARCDALTVGCCSNAMPQVLTITVTTACGTYTGQLYLGDGYCTSTPPATPGWKGSVATQCKVIPGGSCVSRTMNFTLCCLSGNFWLLTVDCGGGTANAQPTAAVCSPLSLTWTTLSSPSCGCVPTPTITVTE